MYDNKEGMTVTNRELMLLVGMVVFLATSVGLGVQLVRPCHGPWMGKPGMERMHGGRHGFKKHGTFGPERLMAAADADKDGMLSKDELLAFHATRAAEMFDTVDTNRDGKLSADELTQGRALMRAKMMAKMQAEQPRDDSR